MKKLFRSRCAALCFLLLLPAVFSACVASIPETTGPVFETSAAEPLSDAGETAGKPLRRGRAEPDGQPMILNADGSYGGTLDAAKYGEGAPLNGAYDVPDSPYYVVNNDYYNLPSTENRTIFPQFASYQQTMQDSDGIACLMMILHYLGEDVKETYTEKALVERYEQLTKKSVYGNGTTADGLSRLVRDLGLGYKASKSGLSISDSSDDAKTKMKGFFRKSIREGKFVLVRYQSPNGYHWKVVIGYDTLGNVRSTSSGSALDSFGDDVIIFAEPNDCCDHRQDGYATERAQDFIVWWRNMTNDGKLLERYSYLVIDPGLDPDLDLQPVDTTVKQTQIEIHLPLNPDGTYGGTRDSSKYGTISSGRGWYDHPDANYYKINDFYNMGSAGSRVMLPHYTVLQQTMRSSCGVCAVTGVLKYYNAEKDSHYDLELRYTEDYERLNNTSIVGKGTGIPGNKKTVESWGYKVADYHYAGSTPRYDTCEELVRFFRSELSKGRPIVVLINFGSGHYLTVIGVDDMGTDFLYDDVIITADSSDYWNSYQDGYDVFSAYKFFSQFTNGGYKVRQGYLVIEKP